MEKLVVSLNEARKMLCTSPNTVQELIETGQIEAYKDGKRWKISIESLKKYVDGRARAERLRRENG